MSSRALSLAAVMFLIGCLAAASAQAENLDAGKSPSQIFAGTCSECHKSSRGLLRKVPAGSLPGFLRQHYTTGGQMAAVLSAYLIANGAADRRPLPPDGQPKPGTDAKPAARMLSPARMPNPTKPNPPIRPTVAAAGGWCDRERRQTQPDRRTTRLQLNRQASAARTAANRLPG